MNRIPALIVGILAATTAAYSQLDLRNQTAVNVGASVDVSRPRRVDAPAKAVVDIGSAERTAFGLINKRRADNGLAPLVWNEDVATIARQHSVDMATMRYFSHKDLDGQYVSDRADKAGIRKWRAIGENIAFNKGYKDPVESAVELWMNSDSHRHNLLDDNWRESAVGVAVAEDGSYFFTQVFLVRK